MCAQSVEMLQREPVTSQLHFADPSIPHRLSRVYGVGIAFPEDVGFCATSPDERPLGFTFGLSAATRAAADLGRSRTATGRRLTGLCAQLAGPGSVGSVGSVGAVGASADSGGGGGGGGGDGDGPKTIVPYGEVTRAAALFARNGYVLVGEALPTLQLAQLREACGRVFGEVADFDAERRGSRGASRYGLGAMTELPEWSNLIDNERITPILDAAFGHSDCQLLRCGMQR